MGRQTISLACLSGLLIFLGGVAPQTARGQQTTSSRWMFQSPSRDPVQLLEGLRQRRMFDLAVDYCRGQLDRADLSDLERATLTVQLMQTQVAAAMLAPPDQRQAGWDAVAQTASTFLEQPDAPRAVLVRLQLALASVSRANLLRQELAAEMADPAKRQEALDHLREARTQLDQLQPAGKGQLPGYITSVASTSTDQRRSPRVRRASASAIIRLVAW